MNTGLARCVFAIVVAGAAGCGPSTPDPVGGGGLSDTGGGGGGEGGDGHGEASAEVAQVINAQQDRLEALDREIAGARDRVEADAASAPEPVEALIALEQDRVAGKSFLAHLERCTAGEVPCPPRLDEPAPPDDYDATTASFSAPFVADAAQWPTVAEGLAGAACACRTRRCVDWVMAELDRWEADLTESDEDAGDAGVSVTAARECLWSRIGR